MTTSGIPILFNAWRHLVDQMDHGDGDADMTAILALERQISAAPARTAQDWACKVALHAHYQRGSFGSDFERDLLAEALAAVGMTRATAAA